MPAAKPERSLQDKATTVLQKWLGVALELGGETKSIQTGQFLSFVEQTLQTVKRLEHLEGHPIAISRALDMGWSMACFVAAPDDDFGPKKRGIPRPGGNAIGQVEQLLLTHERVGRTPAYRNVVVEAARELLKKCEQYRLEGVDGYAKRRATSGRVVKNIQAFFPAA